MDPIAHTFTGAALAATGLNRKTALATAALLIGVNAPDVDAASFFVGAPFSSLAFRRGWTHGVLALALWPFIITGTLLAWDRWVRRRRRPTADPARAGPLLALATLAVWTHPALDWLNNYGMRWLMPFDGRWFYGDAVFVIDPWIWLALGGVAFLAYSRTRAALIAWGAFWALASVLVLVNDVPQPSQALWVAGLAVLLAARYRGLRAPEPGAGIARLAVAMLSAAAVYAGAMIAADVAEVARVRTALAAHGIADVERIMVAPVPANPFAGDVIAATPSAYHVGRWRWLSEPQLTLAEPIPRRDEDFFRVAAQTPEAQRYLTWARFPYVVVEPEDGGHVVQFLDARYSATGRLFGPIVRLDDDLRPVRDSR